MRLLRDVSAVFLSLLLIAAFLPVLTGGTAHAGTVRMNVSEYCFDGTKSSVWIFGLWPQNEDGSANEEAVIESATSSDPGIVAIDSVHSDQVEIKAAGIGTSTIDITFENGDTASVKVSVKKEYFKWFLKEYTLIDGFTYGRKTVKIDSVPGTYGSVKIGKKTYKFKANSKGIAKIKLKKTYKLKTKYVLTVKNNKLAGKPSYKVKGKFTSDTYLSTASRAGDKKVRLVIHGLHTGDKVKLTYKGKTYTVKIKKKHLKKSSLTIKLKKKIPKKDADFKLKIYNKYKQRLANDPFTLFDGITTDPPDGEDF